VDAVAPAAPTVDPSNGSEVSGKTEPGAEVVVKDKDGNVIGQGTANVDGSFTIGLTKPQKQGAALSVTAADAAGNTSGKTVITVHGKEEIKDTWKRLGGANRFETAVAISKEHFPKGSKNAVIARFDTAPDALAAAPFAAKKDAPLLLTQTMVLTPQTKAELSRLKVETVYIAGGTGAVSAGVAGQIQKMGIKVVRLGGADRFETSNTIVKAGWPEGSGEVFVATAWDFPDALSAGAAAGGAKAPVLLVDGKSSGLRADVRKVLEGLKPAQINVAGGTGVVSAGAATQLGKIAKTARYGGADRYATSAQIAKKWHTAGGKVYLATGANFADALTASAVAGKDAAGPMLLVRNNCVPDPVYKALNGTIKPKFGYVLGGKGVISDRVLNSRPSC
ncbi:cell wall-binding repeat-containing protein, partial [Leucobacter iarius]